MSGSDNTGGAGSDAGAFRKPDARLLRPHIEAGHNLIPLHPSSYIDNRGRQRGKSPRDTNWRHRDYRNESPLKWVEEGNNVGVLLGPEDLVIDIDPRHFPEGDNVKVRFASDFDLKLDDIPRTVTGSGGDHYWLRKPRNILVRAALDKYPGIEFKTDGTQVVAGGSVHPKTGGYYRVDDIFGELRSPPMLPDKLRAAIEKIERSASVEPGLHTAEELAFMLEGLARRAVRRMSNR